MAVAEEDWAARVRSAVIADDAEALRALFASAQEIFGAEASVRWAEALSGLDASAQTG